MQKRQLIAHKPAYRDGQLLLDKDFIDEQQFHVHARYAHSRELHGFGVVRGLELSRAGDLAVSVAKGFAVDRRGREIELSEPETLEVAGLPAGALAWVTIGFRTEPIPKDGSGNNRIDCVAFLRVATGVEPADVRLGTIQLDERGRIAADGVGEQQRDRLASVVAPGSVGAEALAPQLRRDWITMAFHPSPMSREDPAFQPPFRIGATQTETDATWQAAAKPEGKADAKAEVRDDEKNKRGGAGTMTIVLPPGVRQMHRFRIAGTTNAAGMTATLIRGGFDPTAMKHLRDEVLTLKIASGPYCETGEIAEAHRSLHDRYRTLAVDVRAEGLAKISLIALDVSY